MSNYQKISHDIVAFENFHSGHENGNVELIQLITEKLKDVLFKAANGNFSRRGLTNFVFSDNDPLSGDIDGISDDARDEVREIQHDIINCFGDGGDD